MPKLDKWALVGGVYYAPELGRLYLAGNVYDDVRFAEGNYIETSAVKIMVSEEPLVVKTNSGTEYELLEPSSDYEKAIGGDARSRIISAMKTANAEKESVK